MPSSSQVIKERISCYGQVTAVEGDTVTVRLALVLPDSIWTGRHRWAASPAAALLFTHLAALPQPCDGDGPQRQQQQQQHVSYLQRLQRQLDGVRPPPEGADPFRCACADGGWNAMLSLLPFRCANCSGAACFWLQLAGVAFRRLQQVQLVALYSTCFRLQLTLPLPCLLSAAWRPASRRSPCGGNTPWCRRWLRPTRRGPAPWHRWVGTQCAYALACKRLEWTDTRGTQRNIMGGCPTCRCCCPTASISWLDRRTHTAAGSL